MLVTIRNLSLTLQDITGIPSYEADIDAEYILEHFGTHDRIIDNNVDPEFRQILYFLEEIQLVRMNSDEVQLVGGSHWRICYWTLRTEKIKPFRE